MVRIDRIEVLRPGVYEIQAGTSKEDQSVSTGHKVAVRSYKNLRTGTQIDAKAGTVIGAELSIVGAPQTQQGANQGCVAISAARSHQPGDENRQN